jgi:group I intron endonuclease
MNVFLNNENIVRNITGLIKKKSMRNLKESIGNRKEKIIGIYKITSPTGKVYIGQSLDIKKRISTYKSSMGHQQPKIHRSFKKYGFDNHVFEIIEECSLGLLDERETFYKKQIIENLGWKQTLFCDLHDQGSGPRSDETRKRLSEGKTGKKHSKPHSNKGVKREGWMNEDIKNKISLANQKPKPPRSKEHNEKIGKSHVGKSKRHKGRISPMKGKTHSQESKEKARLNNLMKNAIPILQYDLNGNFIKKWDRASDAYQISKGIFNCLKNKSESSGGYIWKYYTENYPIKLDLGYNLNNPIIQEYKGKFIQEYKSYYEIPDELKHFNLIKCLIGKNKTYKEYTFKFK